MNVNIYSEWIQIQCTMYTIYIYIYIYIIVIISDLVYDRDQKPNFCIEVLLNLSIYQPSLGNERININKNKYRLYSIKIYCNSILFIRVQSHNKSIQYN